MRELKGPEKNEDPTPKTSGPASPDSPAHPLLTLQQQAGNRAVQRLIQRKLAGGGSIQRRSAVSKIVHNAMRFPGQELDSGTRAFMEPRVNEDLGGVRVHTDSVAAESAEALGAHAYTSGSDIYFATGKFAPGSGEGKKLLAHELVHTLQQRGTTPSLACKSASTNDLIVDPDNMLEQNADRVAEQVLSAAPQRESVKAAPSGVVQRQPVAYSSPPPPYDPVAEDETPRTVAELQAMTNDQLLFEVTRLKHWLTSERNQPAEIPINPKTKRPEPTAAQKKAQKDFDLLASTWHWERNWSDEQRYRKKRKDLGIAEQAAIANERQRRIGLGYLWWAEKSCDEGSRPSEIYQLRPETDGRTSVVQIAPASGGGKVQDLGARPQMTPAQFDAFRQQQGIQDLDQGAFSQLLNSDPAAFGAGGSGAGNPYSLNPFLNFGLSFGKDQEKPNKSYAPWAGATGVVQNQLYLSGLQRSEAGAFNRPATKSDGSRSGNWLGQRGEFGVKSDIWSGGMKFEDTNNRSWVDTRGSQPINHPASRRNFPIIDLRSRTKLSGFPADSLLQVKVSALADPRARFDYYAQGLGDIFGARSRLRGVAAQNLGISVADMEQNSLLVVNADDAAGFAQALRNPTEPRLGGRDPLYTLASYRPAFDAFLSNHPVRITAAGPLYRSTAALQTALRRGVITEAQFTTTLKGVGGTMAQAVVANPRATTTSLQNQATIRDSLGTPTEAARVVTPELLPSLDAGGGSKGSLKAALGGTPRAGAAGAGIAVLTDFGMMILDPDNAGAILDRLPHDAGMGALGGTVGGFVESRVQSQLSQYFLSRAVAGTLPSEGEAMLARSISRRWGGGTAAAAIEIYEMLSGNAPAKSFGDAAWRVSKSFGLGVVSTEIGATVGGAAGAGTTALLAGEGGAAAGSVVPVVGTVVGFVVGVVVGTAVYYVLNKALGPIGDAVGRFEAKVNALGTDWTMKYIYGATMGQDPFAQEYMDRMYPPMAGVIVDEKGNIIDAVQPGMKFDKNGYLIESDDD